MQRGSTLTATAGTWSGIGNSTAYQWQRSSNGTNWVDIAGATGTTYALVVADVGAAVRVSVTTTNPERSATATSNATATVTGAGPANTVAPTISGSARAIILVNGKEVRRVSMQPRMESGGIWHTVLEDLPNGDLTIRIHSPELPEAANTTSMTVRHGEFESRELIDLSADEARARAIADAVEVEDE